MSCTSRGFSDSRLILTGSRAPTDIRSGMYVQASLIATPNAFNGPGSHAVQIELIVSAWTGAIPTGTPNELVSGHASTFTPGSWARTGNRGPPGSAADQCLYHEVP